jgi:hypothetical protein
MSNRKAHDCHILPSAGIVEHQLRRLLGQGKGFACAALPFCGGNVVITTRRLGRTMRRRSRRHRLRCKACVVAVGVRVASARRRSGRARAAAAAAPAALRSAKTPALHRGYHILIERH